MIDNNPPSHWQAIKMGTFMGLAPMLLPMLFYLPWAIDMLDSPYRESILIAYSSIFIITLPGIPFGIGGALTGSSMKRTRLAAWIGSIPGAILGVAVGFITALIIAFNCAIIRKE